MRVITILMICASARLFAQTSEEDAAIAAVQKTFDAMTARDAMRIRATMLPDARLYSIRTDGASTSSALEDFAGRIASTKGDVLERFTSRPSVSIRGRMAQVWGEYEFLRDGKRTHCGVDSVSLFKTAEGWKIATLVYTVEPNGCKVP